jgi:Ser/Thr protein kinase RdoA (MazF antagonist)
LQAFPVTPDRVEAVALSENVTFRVTDRARDSAYVLRLHRPGYQTLAGLNAERAWTRALGKAGIATQSGVRTRDGDYFHEVKIAHTGERRFAGMTEWVEGTLLNEHMGDNADTAERQRCFEQVGVLAALIHNQSSTWTPPADFERPHYDADGLLGENPHWGRFWEHPDLGAAEAGLLLQARARLRDVLRSCPVNPSTYSLIHADLDPDNILVRDNRVTLIDFDDAGFGWHLYELAAALLSEVGAPDFPAVRQALLDGYRKIRALADQDLALLPTFLLIRGLATVGWYADRPEFHGLAELDELKDWVLQQCARLD